MYHMTQKWTNDHCYRLPKEHSVFKKSFNFDPALNFDLLDGLCDRKMNH